MCSLSHVAVVVPHSPFVSVSFHVFHAKAFLLPCSQTEAAPRGSNAKAINQNKTAARCQLATSTHAQATKAAAAETSSKSNDSSSNHIALSRSTRNALFLSAAGIYQINGENVVGSLAPRLCACKPQFILIAFARTFLSFRSQRRVGCRCCCCRCLPLLLLLLLSALNVVSVKKMF